MFPESLQSQFGFFIFLFVCLWGVGGTVVVRGEMEGGVRTQNTPRRPEMRGGDVCFVEKKGGDWVETDE